MKIELEFAELQTPLFSNGINHGVKLPKSEQRTHIKLEWDAETDKLIVWYKGRPSFVPMANVVSFTPKHLADMGLVEPTKEVVPAPAPPVLVKGKIKAQVSTPTSHVFDELK